MKLRTRLGLGIVSITIILLIPLLLTLQALEKVHQTTRSLRDREFAASLLLGSFRETTDDVKRSEDALILLADSASESRMQTQLNRLSVVADSLARYTSRPAATDISNAILALRASTRAEYAAAAAGANNTAEEISAQRTRPALATIERELARTESRLREETRERVDDAASTTVEARRTAAGALAIALLLATLVAIWLTRSISRPVQDLERGMKAVADGDFTQRLPMIERRGDEFGRLATSYQTMTAQLSELDKLKAEFVSVASHELKTPINVIVGYLELLQENIYGELNPKQREICATLGKQAQTLTRLVKRLLDISRFEAGGGKLERRQVDLDRFLHSFETSFQVLALQREIGFRVVKGDNLPAQVLWDEDRINEVLGNLLSNAFKFTDRGGTVELGVDGSENEVCLTVQDTGAGIASEQLPHIFEKFFQANNQAYAAVKGTGLGLAIAREIVEAHGGNVTVESTLGMGTTFTITLPVRAVIARRTPFRRMPVVEEVALTRRAILLMLIVVPTWLLAACAPAQKSRPIPIAPEATFASTLAAAQKRADSGDYAGADRILADFAVRATNKLEAQEITFWRALYLVDPANRSSSMPEGISALDIYLKTPGTVSYRPQAQVLKRTAQTVQALRQTSGAVPKVVGRDTVFVTREDEVAELRDQLGKANAELERIKKRLANPGR